MISLFPLRFKPGITIIMKLWHLLISPLMFLSALLGTLTGGMAAQTDWYKIAPGTELRLLSTNKLDQSDTLWAAVQIRLADGWKTYWRNPGETGIPLVLDWGKSENIEKVEISWPLPKRSQAYGYLDYIYEQEVTLPLAIKLKDFKDIADFKASLTLGVCSDVCIPVQWNGALKLDQTKPSIANSFRIESAMAHVPQIDARNERPFSKIGVDIEKNQLVITPAADPLSNSSLILDLPNSSLLFGLPHSRPELGLLTVESLGEFDLSTLVDQKVQLIYDSAQGPYTQLVKIGLVKMVDETLRFE